MTPGSGKKAKELGKTLDKARIGLPWPISFNILALIERDHTTECVIESDEQCKMIIFDSLFTTFTARFIFKAFIVVI